MLAEEIVNILKNKKKRITPGRRKIIELICHAPSPLSADFLVKRTSMNKTSIYRELEFLLKFGFIQEVNFADGVTRYELKDLDHHHHLICLHCKNVQDIVLKENLSEEEKRIRKLKKFQVARHNLEFFGYCQNCS